MRLQLALVPILVLALCGCPDRTISAVVTEQEKVESKDIPAVANRDLDLLFVIDKSPTMEDEQAALTANFPRFMQILSQIEGGMPNIHVGVISQDLGAGGLSVGGNCNGDGDNGELLATPRIPGCTPPTGRYISDVVSPDGRVRNYTGTLEDTFSCIATLGPFGCGFEQHLGSLKKALIDNPVNAGFLRENALLAIIFISDEDDCTAKDPAIYHPSTPGVGPLADFRCFEWGWECDEGTLARTPGTYTNCRPREDSPYLYHPDELVADIKALKSDPDDIIVATLIGPSATTDPAAPITRVTLGTVGGSTVPVIEPSCTNGEQNAFPMPRLAHFAQQFEWNYFSELCASDLGGSLVQIAKLIRRNWGEPCFESDLDTTDLDPDNPGLQPACSVSDKNSAGETILPPCKMATEDTPAADTAQPCWYVKPDPVRCDEYLTGLLFMVHPESRTVPSDTRTLVQCVSR